MPWSGTVRADDIVVTDQLSGDTMRIDALQRQNRAQSVVNPEKVIRAAGVDIKNAIVGSSEPAPKPQAGRHRRRMRNLLRWWPNRGLRSSSAGQGRSYACDCNSNH